MQHRVRQRWESSVGEANLNQRLLGPRRNVICGVTLWLARHETDQSALKDPRLGDAVDVDADASRAASS